METRKILEETNNSLPYNPSNVKIKDKDEFSILHEDLQKWWASEFGEYVDKNNGFLTPPQRESIPHIYNNNNTLIASPTGSGKTLSAFASIINELHNIDKNKGLKNSVYCVYISPLKSLTNDIKRNVKKPLDGLQQILDEKGEESNIRQAIRHGDTTSNEKSKMLDETPHILNTTPETLSILLNSPKFKEKLKTVKYVIVDEIHSLAENKRGTHLSVSLERLERKSNNKPTRIGCSATVEPLEKIAKFLVGYSTEADRFRECEIVDTRFVREYDIEVKCPTSDLIYSDPSEVTDEFYNSMHNMIQNNTNTLVFTNTRSGAERVLRNLRRKFDDSYDPRNSGCHHGSLSKKEREKIEKKLKNGELDVVTSSTSLELGIDMPEIDLVIQVGSPKSVASLLQRIGRAGHRIDEVVKGRMIVLDRDELVECSVMAKKAEEGFIDRIFIPEKPHDVASQHVYGIAINSVRKEQDVRDIIQSAYPYRNYTEDDWELLMKYLTASYEGLEDNNIYPKIWRDENDDENGEHHYSEFDVGEKLIGKRGKMARVIYMTNIGTIPDSFSMDVFTRGSDNWVGKLDEDYLNTIEKGDVFVLAGDNYEYRYRRGSKVYVDPTSEKANVPSWFSERLPLSYDLGSEILEFQSNYIEEVDTKEYFNNWPIDENTAHALDKMYTEQIRFVGTKSISTPSNLYVEETEDKEEDKIFFYFHSNYGRRFNDGLSRVLAQKISQETTVNVSIAVHDHGFALSIPRNRNVNITDSIKQIKPNNVQNLLRKSLDGTDFLERYFRINSVRSLMILRTYKGRTKSAKQQQVSSKMALGFIEDFDKFAVLEETYREIMEDKLDLNKIEEFISDVNSSKVDVSHREVDTPSPRSFGIATLVESDTILSEDQNKILRKFHRKIIDDIEDT